MQRWYRSLDQYTLTFTKQLFEENEQGYLEEDAFERMCSFRKVFKGIELNPREVLLKKYQRQYAMTIAVMQFLKMLLYR